MLLATGFLACPLEAPAQPAARMARVGYLETLFTLAISAKTAKTLGLRMDPSLLSRADRTVQ